MLLEEEAIDGRALGWKDLKGVLSYCSSVLSRAEPNAILHSTGHCQFRILAVMLSRNSAYPARIWI
jgi:hypothetical protein